MTGYSKKRIEKIVRKNAFNEKKKRPGLIFNPGLALATGPGLMAFYCQQSFLLMCL